METGRARGEYSLRLLTRRSADQGSKALRTGSGRGVRRPAQEFVRVGGRQCPAEQETLGLVTVVFLQE